jgi:hypothetical protein
MSLFDEYYTRQLVGGDLTLPRGPVESTELVQLFESWAAEAKTWTREDGSPIQVTVEIGSRLRGSGDKLFVTFEEGICESPL